MHWTKITGKGAKGRSKPYVARDKADGVAAYFKTQREAEKFVEDYNSNKRNRSYNLPASNKELKKWTAQQLILSYMKSSEFKVEEADFERDRDEFVEASPLQDNLSMVLWNISYHKLFSKTTLLDFTPEVAQKYYDEMIEETYVGNGSEVEKKYSPSTINRNHVTPLSSVWKWGKRNCYGLSNLSNPWLEVEKISGSFKRQRGLKKGELDKLIKHSGECRGSNSSYVKLAIFLMVDTGMRRQEVFNLTWRDIDFQERTIVIGKDKNTRYRERTGQEELGRKVCLPPMSMAMLLQLEMCLAKHGTAPGLVDSNIKIPEKFYPPSGSIFMNTDGEPMTGNGFKQAFEEICKRADKADPNAKPLFDPERKKRLTPHSLRAAAEQMFRRVGLDDKEIDIMKNGPKSHYDVVDDFLDRIHRKLDISFYGKTWEEVEKEQSALTSEQTTSILTRLAEEVE